MRTAVVVLLALVATTALANTCGGNFLAPSSEAGCALGRCACWSYISQCATNELCEDATASDGSPLCQGICTLTPLGITLKTLQWLFIGGLPLAILIWHLYQQRRQRNFVFNEGDIEAGDGDGLDGHADEIDPDSVQKTVTKQLSRQATVAYFSYESPKAGAGHQFPPEDEKAVNKNTLDSYIDLGKFSKAQTTNGAFVIKITPQIYLETMHKRVLPLLFLSMLVVLVLTWIFSVYPTRMDSTALQVGDDSCVNSGGQNCSVFSASSALVDGVNLQRVVTFSHPRIASTPDSMTLGFRVENTTFFGRPGIFTLGNYTVRVTAEGTKLPLVESYTNKLIVACGCVGTSCSSISCQDVPLVGISIKRFDSLLYDVRKRQYTVNVTISPSAKYPTPPDYSLSVQVFHNPYAWSAQLTRGAIGAVSIIVLVHFLYTLSKRNSQEVEGRDRRAYSETPRISSLPPKMSLYERFWDHLSLERQAMALILALMGINFNPVMIFVTRASFGSPSRTYFVFRSILETSMYALSIGALLVILDSYRKDRRGFTNGISWRVMGLRSTIVKAILVFGVLGLRLQMTLTSEGNRVNGQGKKVNYTAMLDTILTGSGFLIFLWVAMHVNRVLKAQRYSETRYLQLSFRYLMLIAYSTLAVFILDVITGNGFGALSTTQSAVLPTNSVVGEMAYAVFMYFGVVAFYPPAPLKPGLIPRAYVVRERRQSLHSPRVASPVPELSSPGSIISSPRSFASPKDVVKPTDDDSRTAPLLQPGSRFDAMPVAAQPDNLFCLETACLMLNCSRHTYFRSTLNLKTDTNAEDGQVKFPQSKYVNQAALARDGLREIAHIHDEATDTNVLVLRHVPNRLIFSFRGTSSKENVKTDMNFALQEIKWLTNHGHKYYAHKGFLSAYETVRDQCHAIFESFHSENLPADSYVYCTGHSLGGALATLAAIDFKCTLHKPTILYNFGSPRVGTHSFHHLYKEHVPLAFRLVNEGDLVVGVPQRMSMSCGKHKRLYRHVGTEVVMDGKVNGDFIIRPTFAEKHLIIEGAKKVGRHFLPSYRENLNIIVDGVLRSEQSIGEFHQEDALKEVLNTLDTQTVDTLRSKERQLDDLV
ncbi:hypothetical protein AeMF1_018016 [Aphanomyces euteiches]|nr:hypothetical protein AeMF1_018016 [Aphanomyces euteiches]